MDPNGNQFGEKISIRFKVVEKVDEGEFFQRALGIYASLNANEKGLFDLTVECLKQADNNAKRAKEILVKKRVTTSSQICSFQRPKKTSMDKSKNDANLDHLVFKDL